MTSMTNTSSSVHPMSNNPISDRVANRRAVYVITEKTTNDGTRSFWTKVGAAFDNKDGSITIKLEALPLSGTLQIRDDDRDVRRDRAATAPF